MGVARNRQADVRPEGLTVHSSVNVAPPPSFAAERLKVRFPRRWRSEPPINAHAARVEREALAWFRSIGCSEREIRMVRAFQPSRYVGLPFPLAGYREALFLAKYLSLWLLWDDVAIESGANAWKIRGEHVLSPGAAALPAGATRFDAAWLSLLRELSGSMSPGWIEMFCGTMAAWSSAALDEARLSRRWMEGRARISFEESVQCRINTIGMHATSYFLEYAGGIELPAGFHEHPTVGAIKDVAGEIVGLGNDIWSLGKDYALGYINVILALKEELGVSLFEAFCRVIAAHNDSVAELDALASGLPSFGSGYDAWVAKWLTDLRHCCVGFELWESVAPRYREHTLLVNGAPLTPTIVYYERGSSRYSVPAPVPVSASASASVSASVSAPASA